MPIANRRRTLLIAWALIIAAGAAAGWWQAMRTRATRLRGLLDDARRCAVAFLPDEMGLLAGTPADLANPDYLSIKARLARLRQASPDARSVCILRFVPTTGMAVLLADSEPPNSRKIANPGDDYAGTSSIGLQTILRGRLPAVEGPLADSSGKRVTSYALINETPSDGNPVPVRNILALDVSAGTWTRDLVGHGLQVAVYGWLLLGLSLGGLLVWRGYSHQRQLIRKLSQAAEQSRIGLVITDADRRIEYVNAGFCAISGWRREDLIGHPVQMLASSEMTDEQFHEIFDAIHAGRTWSGETVNRRRDGGTYPARSVASPMYDEAGRLTHIISVIDDLTERKQVDAALAYAKERAEAGERAKDRFLAMMGHEIRTPLNGINGFASLLFDTELTPEQRECVQAIHDSGESLLKLTSDVLDYSKIDSGRLSLEPQPCSPLECIEFALETLAPRAAEKGLDVLHSVACNVPAMVLADHGRMRQVLINLVGNAIKFTPAGEIEVTVGAEALPEDHHLTHPAAGPAPARSWLLTFRVRDTGIGIAPEECGKLFKPFSQIDSSATRKFGGVGLGLAISRSLAQMMGGDISVDSELGRGSSFSFTVIAGEAPAPGDSAGAPALAILKSHALAVVCDRAPLRRELVQLAEAWGLRPTECLREQLAAEAWDIAVIDLALADLSAWRQLFAQRPELPSRPLVALVAATFPAAERESLRGFFRAFVRKPAHHDALRALLAASVQPEAHPAPAAGTTAPQGRGLGLAVLLVADNPVNQRLTQKMLENIRCHWDLAEDGMVAVSRLDRGNYDLVLLDLYVPEVDSRAVVERIRRGEAGARNQDIWITVVTAADTPESERRHILEHGANDCLVKPFKLDDLEAALWRGMRHSPPGV